MAGPITRDAFSNPEFRATAFGSSRGPTISNVSTWRAGASRTRVTPPSVARAKTIGSVAVPVRVTTASAADVIIAATCVQTTRRRVSIRSTIDPANRPKSVYGAKRQKSSVATASGERESESTSHARATFCIHEPASDTIWPAKKSR